MRSVERAPEPESGDMSGAEPEAGAASGQEVSSPEGSGGYAAHAASPDTPASVPSLGSGRYRPPEDSPVAEVSAQPVVIADDDADAWGPWRAPASIAADGPAEQAGGVASSEARDIKRPRRGIPSGSRVRLGAVPAPNESEEDLLRQVFLRELEVRRQEGEALGLRLQAEANEPLPMLSHFYGPPTSTESMYDSLALALTDRSFLTRVALGGGGSQDVLGGATGITGKGRLDRPEEFAEETPYMPPRLPRFPEEEQQRAPQKLLIDQATITDNALSEWHAWLKLAQQGRSLREWGVISSDIVTAVQYLGEAPPQEEPAARGGRWHSGRGGRRKQQQQEYPTSVGVLLYLKKALKCIDCFDRAPSQYRGLLLGPSSAMALERPDGGTALDEREAWKYIVASISVRVQRLLDKKRAKNRAVAAMTAIYLQTPKAAAAKPRPVAPATPTTPAEDNSSDSSSEASEVSGESQLEGEGVAEAIGVIRSCQDKGESLWTPGVVSRLFGTPEFPHKVFPEAAAMTAKFAATASEATGIDPSGAAASSDAAAGTAAGIAAMAPPTPAATEPKSPASLASVIYRPGRLVEKRRLMYHLDVGALLRRPRKVLLPRADATGKGVYPPRAFGRSIFRAFGRHRFRNRNPIRRLRKRSGGSPSCYRKRQSGSVNSFDLCVLKEKKTFGEHVLHVWHEGFEWHGLGMKLGMNVSLICACFGSLGNPEAPQSLQALTCLPSLLSLRSSRVRTPAMFVDVVAATLFAGLLFAWSLLSGIAFWWCSLVLQFFRKWFRRRGLRTKRFRAKCRRKPSCFRMKLRNRWVRLETQRQLVVVRKEKVGCSALLDGMLRKCLLFWHVFLGMFGMLVHVCERGDDEQPRPAKAEVSEHRLRAMHRGLPLPGVGTSADPLNLDPVDPYDPEGLLEPPAGLPEGRRPPPQPDRIVDPSGDPEDPGDETEDLRVPLSSFSLHRHRCNGHFPFDENCMACCSSKGRVPARRLRRKLQRENQTVGLDFFFFGKLRVLLVMHLGSRYTLCLPAPELNDDLAFNITRALKECGLTGKAVTFRLDNEASLVALVERTARHRACPASAVITDVVPGYRPQSKGSIEKQVDIMKSGFWAIWLDLEAQINQAQPSSDSPEGIKLPLGGLLWQACIFYTARCFNLWSSAPGNSSVSLDRLHEEYVQKTRTRAFGSVCQARVARSKSHLQRYRGARAVKIVYLGPVHARGGGVYGVPLNGKDIDVFPAVAVGKEEVAIDVPTLLGLAKEKPLELDDQDPERPTLFEPAEREEEEPGFASEGVDADGDEEMIQDDEGLGDYSPSLPPSGDEAQEVIDNEGDMEVDMSIDWLTSHLLERVFEGPELRASSSDVSQSFTLKFGGSRICCKVPQHALSETSGEVLSPDLLYLSMKLELEELEAFGVGEVIPEYEARKEARSSGRRVLTSRWVNSVKKPGLYRSRLVVRDYASMGGTTLAEGIYSPTTSLEGLRVLLSLLCKRGSVLSCDVSVAFMHAAVSRPEYVELPSNVSIAASKGPLEAGAKVYLRLKKAMNGLRSAPLSWYQELSSYLRNVGFEPSLDPTIFRRKTAKGLVVVLFYVDDLLIYSEDPKEGRKVFDDLQKRYKLKLTGELLEDSPGEVSFLGRRIFRRRGGERRVYFGLAENYLDSCCEEFGITKPSPKLVSLEKRYAELLKKGLTEAISPAAHERYRRTLGRLAWAALSRPDLQFVCGFLGRHQAGPNEAAESCVRDVLRWVKGLPHKVQVFPSSREILEEDADAEAISCFTDASWSLNSVSGGILTWENCALKSFSRKQSTTALSSAEAELAALTEVAREGLYIALLVETVLEGVPKDREHGYYVLKGYSDSESAVCISKMSTLLRKVRHIELRAAFLQELVAKGRFTVEHVPGAINPADSLTKSPTTCNLSSLYDVSGLVDEPGAWEEPSKQKASVSFDIEPNSLEDPDFPEVPESWLGSAQKVAKKAASLIVAELCCEEGSALAKACSSIPEVAYFGVTKEVDLLSYNGLRLLQEVFGVLSYGTVRVYAHLSTPCSAGCGLRHLRFKKGGKALERWRAALAVHKRSWRRIGKLLAPYKDSERLVLSHEWPEKSGLWGETVFKGTAKKLLLEHGCLVDRCCFEKGKDRPWKRWWFVSNSPQFTWDLSKNQCSGGHSHHQMDLPASGLYPARLGKTLVEVALKSAGSRQRTRA